MFAPVRLHLIGGVGQDDVAGGRLIPPVAFPPLDQISSSSVAALGRVNMPCLLAGGDCFRRAAGRELARGAPLPGLALAADVGDLDAATAPGNRAERRVGIRAPWSIVWRSTAVALIPIEPRRSSIGDQPATMPIAAAALPADIRQQFGVFKPFANRHVGVLSLFASRAGEAKLAEEDAGPARLQLVLVTDDGASLADLMRVLRAGHELRVITGGEALEALVASSPDIVFIERDLVECSALQLCQTLRRHPATWGLQIIVFTARSEDAFGTLGLQHGADRCSGFATSGRELLLRAHRLVEDAARRRSVRIRCGELELDEVQHRAWFRTQPLDLSATEMRLLKLLMLAPGRVQSREELLPAVGGAGSRHDLRKVDWYISRVRRNLELAGGGALIATVRAEGYVLTPGATS